MTAAAPDRLHYCSLPYPALEKTFTDLGLPAYRARQFRHAVYAEHAPDIDGVAVLPKEARRRLNERGHIALPRVVTEQISTDGTCKWLLAFTDGRKAETVFIPEKERGTLCVSSQIGCSLSCSFCHTGTQKLERNLTADEIVCQYLFAVRRLKELHSPVTVTRFVMMGQGEPLINYRNVADAITILTDPDGCAFSKRRVTLSTSGYIPKIQECGEELGVNLAVSLHAVDDDVRDELVPLNRKYPIAELLDACRAYPCSGEFRKITFEYVMLHEVNDSRREARKLADLIGDMHAKVNMIPFNPWPGSVYRCSTKTAMANFAMILQEAGVPVTIRRPRGRDILAACGQLKSADPVAVTA